MRRQKQREADSDMKEADQIVSLVSSFLAAIWYKMIFLLIVCLSLEIFICMDFMENALQSAPCAANDAARRGAEVRAQ